MCVQRVVLDDDAKGFNGCYDIKGFDDKRLMYPCFLFVVGGRGEGRSARRVDLL